MKEDCRREAASAVEIRVGAGGKRRNPQEVESTELSVGDPGLLLPLEPNIWEVNCCGGPGEGIPPKITG